MVQLANRSIDLMDGLADESGNIFNMTRLGYAYVTANPATAAQIQTTLAPYRPLPVGEIRLHTDSSSDLAAQQNGADVLLNQQTIAKEFPHFSQNVQAVIHARRGGAISAQQLGIYLLAEARKLGVKELRGELIGIEQDLQGVKAVTVRTATGTERIESRIFINAAGPFVPEIAAMLDISLPIFSVFQQKIAFQDQLGVVPRDAPFTIFTDPQMLHWSESERQLLQSESAYQWMIEQLPGGLHIKPEGGADSTWVKLGWAINQSPEVPRWSRDGAPEFPDIVLRGATTLVPGLKQYIDNIPKPIAHYGGYYTKTAENLPIIGPMGIKGAYMVGALSGFGTMMSCAAGELVADWIAGDELPIYAEWLSLGRYARAEYAAKIQEMQSTGEL